MLNYIKGDGAKRDKDSYFWILGRDDDVVEPEVIGKFGMPERIIF